MKYFEIRKITKKEYLEKTKDPYFNTPYEQALIPVGNKVYCAARGNNVEFNVNLFNKENKDA